MKSLVFILVRSSKNRFLELLRKPVKLLMYVFILAVIILLLLLPALTKQNVSREFINLFWLKGIFFLFVLFFAGFAVQKGLTSGDSIFDMNDVNLLFVSPVSPKGILMYGLVRLTKISFLSGFFILFQGNSLGANFGISFGGLLILLGAFMLSMILLSVLSILIYSVTNGKPRRKFLVRALAILSVTPLVGYVVWQYLSQGDLLTALGLTINSPFLRWFPAAGWAAEGAIAFLAGDIGIGLGFLGLIVIAGVLLTAYIAVSKADYYEDVLVATETAFEKRRAALEGDIHSASAKSKRKINVTKTGIGGQGANAVFYKHLRESFRENRFGLLTLSSVMIIFSSAIAAYFMSRGADKNVNCVVILQVLMWIQVFLIGTGRGLKELYSHYIYLIPENSFSKLIWSNLELVFKTLLESIFIFSLAGFILGDNIFIILGAIFVYALFSLLLIGINLLFMRWTDANISAGVLIFIYLLGVIVIMLPGLIPALFVGYSLGGLWGTLAGLGILTVWELIAALSCFSLSKGVLHNCDMPVLKMGK